MRRIGFTVAALVTFLLAYALWRLLGAYVAVFACYGLAAWLVCRRWRIPRLISLILMLAGTYCMRYVHAAPLPGDQEGDPFLFAPLIAWAWWLTTLLSPVTVYYEPAGDGVTLQEQRTYRVVDGYEGDLDSLDDMEVARLFGIRSPYFRGYRITRFPGLRQQLAEQGVLEASEGAKVTRHPSTIHPAA